MKIRDHISYYIRCLIKIFTCAPDVSLFDCLKVSKKFTFLQELVHAVDRVINGSIVYQIIRINCLSIKFFHRHRHRRTFCFFFGINLCRHITSTGDFNHFGNIICRFSYYYRTITADIKECNGFFGIFEIFQI